MTDAEILGLVKTDVGLLQTDTQHEAFLEHCLSSAKAFIEREGVTLDLNSSEDIGIVRMYAAYLFRKRAVTANNSFTGAMPRMLRWALNNRVLAEHGGVSDES